VAVEAGEEDEGFADGVRGCFGGEAGEREEQVGGLDGAEDEDGHGDGEEGGGGSGFLASGEDAAVVVGEVEGEIGGVGGLGEEGVAGEFADGVAECLVGEGTGMVEDGDVRVGGGSEGEWCGGSGIGGLWGWVEGRGR
jgi:hypothetical protein